MNIKELPRMIDLSCVRTNSSLKELKEMVVMAKKYHVICVFAMPCYTPWLVEQMKDYPDILIGGTTGFPSGADLPETKAETARKLIDMGCGEIDMVINVGALIGGDYELVERDIAGVKKECGDIPLKVILETPLLTDEQIAMGAKLAVKNGANFVKTGTGWMGSATVHAIEVIKKAIGDTARIKAAGGVKDLATIKAMVDAGCTRFGIGIKSAQAIFDEAKL